MDGRRQQAQELRRQIEWTLARAVDPSDVLPMLHRLVASRRRRVRREPLREPAPRRAAGRARSVARRPLRAPRPRPPPGRRPRVGHPGALPDAPRQLQIRGDAPTSARWRARRRIPGTRTTSGTCSTSRSGARATPSAGSGARTKSASYSGEVAASYAHALARVGRLAEARKVLARAMKRNSSREHAALLRWLEQGAPPDKRPSAASGRPGPLRSRSAGCDATEPTSRTAPTPLSRASSRRTTAAPTTRRPLRAPTVAELEAILARGLASLPLDTKQRDTRQGARARRGGLLCAPDGRPRGVGSHDRRRDRRGRRVRHRLRRPRSSHAGRGGGVLPRRRRGPPGTLRRAALPSGSDAGRRPLRHQRRR